MLQPEGLKVEMKPDFVCKLKNAFFGLKQAPASELTDSDGPYRII